MHYEKHINSLGKSSIVLNVDNVKLPIVDFDMEPLFTFRVDTYNVLKANATRQNWDAVFKVVNNFLNVEFNEDERAKYAALILLMHYNILKSLGREGTIDRDSAIHLEQYLSSMLLKFDDEVSLMSRILSYVKQHVPIVATENAGERPIDSTAMTFYYDDVVQLTAIVVLCKMLTPIFGMFIECCKKRMDTRYKESHCVTILGEILDKNCSELNEKLRNYIRKIVDNSLNKANVGNIYHGYTSYNTVQNVYGILLTRRFNTVDILESGSNLMKYVVSCIRSAVKASNSSSNKMAIGEILLPSDTSSSSDDGNASNLEKETIPSSKTSDFDLIVEEAALELHNRFVSQMDLDVDVLAHAEAYYMTSHVGLNNVASYILATAFGTDLCGGQSVQSIPNTMLNKLIPMMQLYFIQQGYLDLVHALSIIDLGTPKITITGADNQLKSSWNSSQEYRLCAAKFPMVVGDIAWDTRLKEIVDDVTTREFIYNTPPVIWDLMKSNVMNGQQYVTPPMLSASICSYFLEQYP